jgi:aryl-alcohol dehydrogenase-like predicted oxidoreductase
MNYRLLGRTGVKVSELCLGTMTFGENFFNIAVVDQLSADAMVARALDAGVNFFDTADVYSYGRSEEVLAQALKASGIARDKIIIATKVRSAMSEPATTGTGDVNNVGLSRQHIFAAIEDSLRRLKTDYIDLYQVHGWDHLTPIEETLRALDDLVRQGKVRYLGCSNWSARHLMKALGLRALMIGQVLFRCRLTIRSSDVISNTNCCRCVAKKTLAFCHGRRYRVDFCPESIVAMIRIPKERGALTLISPLSMWSTGLTRLRPWRGSPKTEA